MNSYFGLINLDLGTTQEGYIDKDGKMAYKEGTPIEANELARMREKNKPLPKLPPPLPKINYDDQIIEWKGKVGHTSFDYKNYLENICKLHEVELDLKSEWIRFTFYKNIHMFYFKIKGKRINVNRVSEDLEDLSNQITK